MQRFLFIVGGMFLGALSGLFLGLVLGSWMVARAINEGACGLFGLFGAFVAFVVGVIGMVLGGWLAGRVSRERTSHPPGLTMQVPNFCRSAKPAPWD
ncbi:hypothetical protein [Singulisphaera sp. PoT]|uniref:hypothetical protein n=1 Tax=Singulisphaera sp. PoT TaxID=3411797 RepID=UPI003BF46332